MIPIYVLTDTWSSRLTGMAYVKADGTDAAQWKSLREEKNR